MCTLFQIWLSFSRFLRSHEFENYISVGYCISPWTVCLLQQPCVTIILNQMLWSIPMQFQLSNSVFSSCHPTPLKRNCSPHSIWKWNTVPTNMFAPTPSQESSVINIVQSLEFGQFLTANEKGYWRWKSSV